MKQIQLTRGYAALVDDDDFEALAKHKWQVQLARNGLKYAVRIETINGKRCYVAMHRVVLGLKNRKQKCDHRDVNGLNNQKYNLRVATNSQNLANQRPRKGRRLKGVYRYDGTRKTTWQVRILGNYLGTFASEEEAMKVYNATLLKKRGAFARLNSL